MRMKSIIKLVLEYTHGRSTGTLAGHLKRLASYRDIPVLTMRGELHLALSPSASSASAQARGFGPPKWRTSIRRQK